MLLNRMVAVAVASLMLSAPASGDAQEIGAAVADKLSCAKPAAAAPAEVQGGGSSVAATTGPKVVFKLNRAEDAPTILRFVTNYLKAEPDAQVAVVAYGTGIDFMLRGAVDANGKPYAEQMAALAASGVAFKACNNTLKSRELTAEAISAPAVVVPGAVNEIIRLQTREGYAYFEH